MSNVGRVLTLRITIMDHEASKWIWDAYPKPVNGIQVAALSNGDMFTERDMLSQAACFYICEEGESHDEAIYRGNMGEPYNSPEHAARDAELEVEEGVAWEIIDVRGNVVRSSK